MYFSIVGGQTTARMRPSRVFYAARSNCY